MVLKILAFLCLGRKLCLGNKRVKGDVDSDLYDKPLRSCNVTMNCIVLHCITEPVSIGNESCLLKICKTLYLPDLSCNM